MFLTASCSHVVAGTLWQDVHPAAAAKYITSGPANILYYMCEQQVFTVAEAGADTRFIQYQILCWF